MSVFSDAGDARFRDPRTIMLEDGTILEAEKFILCVGGRARRLNFPGSEHALTHSDVWSLPKLPRSIAIIGGAATGCQLASVFSAFGTVTHVIEVAPRILGAEDEMVSEGITEAFRGRGISITAGISGVDRIEVKDSGLDLVYTHEGQSHTLNVEKVVMAVGWPGNIDRLELATAGIETERGYIKVSSSLATNVPHIFAAGDITGRMMLVQSATGEGAIAAENALKGTDRTLHSPHRPARRLYRP